MARAAIDIGSNSILLTIIDEDGGVLHDEARVAGLGTGLGDRGLFLPDRMSAAEKILADYLQIARSHGIEPYSIRAIATSAARRSMNARTWFAKIQRLTGLRTRIISGDEEAQLTWLGAVKGLTIPDGPRLIVDLGGGSTELVLGDNETISMKRSLEIGSVRLTEQVEASALAQLRAMVDSLLLEMTFDPLPKTVIAVAGSATTLAAMTCGLSTYDPRQIHGLQVSRQHLAALEKSLLAASPEERLVLARVSPERADFLLAGATILDRILRTVRKTGLVISDGGLRYGLLS